MKISPPSCGLSARGADLVIAAGGDRTVASVVNGVRQSSASIGIVPSGTGNLLARAMAIPTTAEAALDLIVGDHALQPLDVMRIGAQVFVLDVSAGISARAMRDTPPEHKQRFGILAYLWPLVRDLVRIRRRDFNLTVDGRPFQVRASEILITNGAFLDQPPFPYGPREVLSKLHPRFNTDAPHGSNIRAILGMYHFAVHLTLHTRATRSIISPGA